MNWEKKKKDKVIGGKRGPNQPCVWDGGNGESARDEDLRTKGVLKKEDPSKPFALACGTTHPPSHRPVPWALQT